MFAATGAIVAEFVGANSGLGYLLLRATSYLDMPLIFAVLVALSAIGILFSYAVQCARAAVHAVVAQAMIASRRHDTDGQETP